MIFFSRKPRIEKIPNLYETQWWSYEELRNFQEARLKKIVKYAYRHIPGYRKKFKEAGLTPKDIKKIEDLCKLPITTREELQNNPAFINEKLIYKKLQTGGSTGEPLVYYDSKESKDIRMMSHERGWSWNGYQKDKKLAVISASQGIIKRENVLNIYGDLTNENLPANIEQLKQFGPLHLRGYVSSIYILALYCLQENVVIEGIESINTISENLYDYQREIIEKAFRCKVFEEYCCNDGGACAWECGHHDGLHYAMERAIIEEVDGEIIVTDLWNKAIPFIRYKNGDAVKFLNHKCGCGRQLPLITVKGRTNDIIISPSGPISPTYIMHNWYDTYNKISFQNASEDFRAGIRMVQFIQKPQYNLNINTVTNDNFNAIMKENFENGMIDIFKGMKINFNYVDEIISTEKGKRSFIINEDKELLKKFQAS